MNTAIFLNSLLIVSAEHQTNDKSEITNEINLIKILSTLWTLIILHYSVHT